MHWPRGYWSRGQTGTERKRENNQRKIKKHRSVVSTHADPSNSSQMQLETPGGVGVSCPCERRAMVEFKPKTDTGLCVAKWPACNHYTSPIPQLIPQNVTHHILIWNDHPQPGEQKGDDTAEILLFFFKKKQQQQQKEIQPAKSINLKQSTATDTKVLGWDPER